MLCEFGYEFHQQLELHIRLCLTCQTHIKHRRHKASVLSVAVTIVSAAVMAPLLFFVDKSVRFALIFIFLAALKFGWLGRRGVGYGRVRRFKSAIGLARG